MRAGVAHDQPDHPVQGGLVLFCPACPQMDINIPSETEWKTDNRQARTSFFIASTTMTCHRLLFQPQLVADGNMKLVHLIMKRPEDDVSLSDGELFMVKRALYAEHLAHAPQRQPVISHWSIVNL